MKGYVNSVGEAQAMLKGKTERVTENYSRMTPLALATLMALVQPICAASRSVFVTLHTHQARYYTTFSLPLAAEAVRRLAHHLLDKPYGGQQRPQ